MCKEQVFPVPGDRNLGTVGHLNIASVMTHEFLYVIKIDKM